MFRQSTGNVTQLLQAGADPALGPKSAVDIARFFELPEMVELLNRPPS